MGYRVVGDGVAGGGGEEDAVRVQADGVARDGVTAGGGKVDAVIVVRDGVIGYDVTDERNDVDTIVVVRGNQVPVNCVVVGFPFKANAHLTVA